VFLYRCDSSADYRSVMKRDISLTISHYRSAAQPWWKQAFILGYYPWSSVIVVFDVLRDWHVAVTTCFCLLHFSFFDHNSCFCSSTTSPVSLRSVFQLFLGFSLSLRSLSSATIESSHRSEVEFMTHASFSRRFLFSYST